MRYATPTKQSQKGLKMDTNLDLQFEELEGMEAMFNASEFGIGLSGGMSFWVVATTAALLT
jgi:hypothetical protein